MVSLDEGTLDEGVLNALADTFAGGFFAGLGGRTDFSAAGFTACGLPFDGPSTGFFFAEAPFAGDASVGESFFGDLSDTKSFDLGSLAGASFGADFFADVSGGEGFTAGEGFGPGFFAGDFLTGGFFAGGLFRGSPFAGAPFATPFFEPGDDSDLFVFGLAPSAFDGGLPTAPGLAEESGRCNALE
ncbi:MAG: hypothetical protein GXP27_01525 [Planctomycetes bacterium]|nr:hypothetical protein [Planctomycetota bacterium]